MELGDFDHVDRQKLCKKGSESGYPMGVLASSLVSCSWGRRFMLNREALQEIRSQRGIAAGSHFARHELAIHVVSLIDLLRAWSREQVRC